MIRYKQGFRRYAARAVSLARWQATQTMGAVQGWPVYRPMMDHSVYEADNRLLPSTRKHLAKIVHQVSITTPPESPAVVEFEHGTALVGHLGYDIDYRRFRARLAEKWERFTRWYDPAKHRLLATSRGARQSAFELAERTGHSLNPAGLRVVPWAVPQRATSITVGGGALTVFHYGGAFPYAKGTHDVLRAARRLPHVRFEICADPSHECLRVPLPSNVTVVPHLDRSAYLRSLNRAHVLANPIYSDGWGVILDATSRAIPVVSYRTFDKDEAVGHDETGELIDVPKELSWYDGFFGEHWHSWREYNAFLRDATPTPADALAAAIARYDEDRERLRRHSHTTAAFHATHHDPRARFATILNVYSELLSSLSRTP